MQSIIGLFLSYIASTHAYFFIVPDHELHCNFQTGDRATLNYQLESSDYAIDVESIKVNDCTYDPNNNDIILQENFYNEHSHSFVYNLERSFTFDLSRCTQFIEGNYFNRTADIDFNIGVNSTNSDKFLAIKRVKFQAVCSIATEFTATLDFNHIEESQVIVNDTEAITYEFTYTIPDVVFSNITHDADSPLNNTCNGEEVDVTDEVRETIQSRLQIEVEQTLYLPGLIVTVEITSIRCGSLIIEFDVNIRKTESTIHIPVADVVEEEMLASNSNITAAILDKEPEEIEQVFEETDDASFFQLEQVVPNYEHQVQSHTFEVVMIKEKQNTASNYEDPFTVIRNLTEDLVSGQPVQFRIQGYNIGRNISWTPTSCKVMDTSRDMSFELFNTQCENGVKTCSNSAPINLNVNSFVQGVDTVWHTNEYYNFSQDSTIWAFGYNLFLFSIESSNSLEIECRITLCSEFDTNSMCVKAANCC